MKGLSKFTCLRLQRSFLSFVAVVVSSVPDWQIAPEFSNPCCGNQAIFVGPAIIVSTTLVPYAAVLDFRTAQSVDEFTLFWFSDMSVLMSRGFASSLVFCFFFFLTTSKISPHLNNLCKAANVRVRKKRGKNFKRDRFLLYIHTYDTFYIYILYIYEYIL